MSETITAFGRKWRQVWREGPETWTAGHEPLFAAWAQLFGETYPGVLGATDSSGEGTSRRHWLVAGRVLESDLARWAIYVSTESACPVCGATSAEDWYLCGGPLCPKPEASLAEPGGTCSMPPADPYTAMAREFLAKMGKTVRGTPDLGTPEERGERVARMLEELLEVAEALGVKVRTRHGWEVRAIGDLDLWAGPCSDLANALHELADLQVAVAGTAAMFGLPLLQAVREVHVANMQKTPQGPGRKPLKPAGWTPADVSGLVTSADRSTCLASDECGVLCQERCTVKESVRLGQAAAALQDAPGDVLRQLAGADLSQPRDCDRIDCRPFAIQPCVCPCACHEMAP